MLLILLSSIIIIFICVLIHYEALIQVGRVCNKLNIHNRFKIVVGVLSAILAHVIEVWVFGLGYYFIIRFDSSNAIVDLSGQIHNDFFDNIYFSFVSYTSLGYGDLVPSGGMSFLAATEALIGLVFIAWSASFLYLQMEKYWNHVEV